tara:strand:- start:6678 stop:6980 length:303 start_codon:yes stop_codon:yes gene_type:complete
MGSSEALFRATLNRISARLGHGLADVAAELAVLAQDAPDRLRQEWDLFQEEVRAEADRLEHPNQETSAGTGQEPDASPQERIDRLRAMVASISRELEEQA